MTAPTPTPNTDGPTPDPSISAPPTGSPEPWKAGTHSRFAGRSAEEILGIAEQAAATLDRFNQPMPQPVAPQASRFDLDIDPDGYVQGKDVQKLLERFANQPIPTDPVARALAAQGLYQGLRAECAEKSRKTGEINPFDRWESEIKTEVSRLPIDNWNLDNLNIIVNIVKSRHIDELAAEKAQRIVDGSHPTIRSGTGGSGSGPLTPQRTLGSDSLPKGWVDRAKALGIDDKVVLEFCDITGQTPEQYLAEVEKFGKNGAIIRG